MISIVTLKRQHEEIGNILEDLKRIIKNQSIEADVQYIANQISSLAGKLKIHLSTEDRFMYPQLLKSENVEVRKTAQAFMEEMGYISNEFMEYKDKFNTKTKISNDIDKFLEETKRVFSVLEKRIEKEDMSLYSIL